MSYITIFLQLFVAFGLLNVWLIRCNKKTTYRGSNACSLKDEFTAYGLPLWSFYVIGLTATICYFFAAFFGSTQVTKTNGDPARTSSTTWPFL